MDKNILSIIIRKPIDKVFSFALESDNVPKWINGIREEIPSERPVKKGTKLRNIGVDKDAEWSEYEMIEFNPPKSFTLQQLNGDYFVKYSFNEVDGGTEFEYLEWSESGLGGRLEMEALEKLKELIESE